MFFTAICELNHETPSEFFKRRHLETRGVEDIDSEKLPYALCNVHLTRWEKFRLRHHTLKGYARRQSGSSLEMTHWYKGVDENCYKTPDEVNPC